MSISCSVSNQKPALKPVSQLTPSTESKYLKLRRTIEHIASFRWTEVGSNRRSWLFYITLLNEHIWKRKYRLDTLKRKLKERKKERKNNKERENSQRLRKSVKGDEDDDDDGGGGGDGGD